MVALWGTTVNALGVIAGCLIGAILPRMPERMQNIIMQALGLSVLFLGISMGLKPYMRLDEWNPIFVIASLVLGGIIGEAVKLDARLERLGKRLEEAVKKRAGGRQTGKVAEGFVTATLIFCVGAMAVLGSIESGLNGNHAILYTKTLLDGTLAMLLTATLGIGVIFSAAAVFIYQGSIALSAEFITSFLNEAELSAIVTEVGATGGILIAALGINILKIIKVNAINLLPSIFVIAGLVLVGVRLGFY